MEGKSQRLILIVVCIIFSLSFTLLTVSEAFAVKTWTGAIDSDWTKGGNYNDGVAPGGGDDVVVPDVSPNPSPTIESGDAAEVNNLEIDGDGAEVTVNGDLNANGSITVTDGGELELESGTVTADGLIVDERGYPSTPCTLSFNSNAALYVDGDMVLREDVSLFIDRRGDFLGSIIVEGDLDFNNAIVDYHIHIDNDTDLDKALAGDIGGTLSGPAFFDLTAHDPLFYLGYSAILMTIDAVAPDVENMIKHLTAAFQDPLKILKGTFTAVEREDGKTDVVVTAVPEFPVGATAPLIGLLIFSTFFIRKKLVKIKS